MKHTPIFLVFLLVALACGNPNRQNQTQTQTQTKPGAVSNQPTVRVKAAELTAAYKENEIAADESFRGKPLEVTGKITNIAETFGQISVDLEGHKDETGFNIVTVKCSFPESQKPAVARLKNGQNVTLTGTGDGMTAGLYVGLENCVVKN